MAVTYVVSFGAGPPFTDFGLSMLTKGLDNLDSLYLPPWQADAVESLRMMVGIGLRRSGPFELRVTGGELMTLNKASYMADDVKLYKAVVDDMQDIYMLRSPGDYVPTENELEWAEGAGKKYLG